MERWRGLVAISGDAGASDADASDSADADPDGSLDAASAQSTSCAKEVPPIGGGGCSADPIDPWRYSCSYP